MQVCSLSSCIAEFHPIFIRFTFILIHICKVNTPNEIKEKKYCDLIDYHIRVPHAESEKIKLSHLNCNEWMWLSWSTHQLFFTPLCRILMWTLIMRNLQQRRYQHAA